jgi:hypothetical protein
MKKVSAQFKRRDFDAAIAEREDYVWKRRHW